MPSSASSLKSHSQLIRWTSQCFLRPSQWAICPLWSSSPVRSNFHHPFRVFPRTTRETSENIQNADLQRSCFFPCFWIFLIREMVSFFFLCNYKLYKLWSVFSWTVRQNLPLAILRQINPFSRWLWSAIHSLVRNTSLNIQIQQKSPAGLADSSTYGIWATNLTELPVSTLPKGGSHQICLHLWS